ncbi:Uncharacterised protein [Mycobacteroides abscessus subsp. abscessus]|nr:Uncharacterised protein [Mycobacteroides abscessus subsp. abscessus]
MPTERFRRWATSAVESVSSSSTSISAGVHRRRRFDSPVRPCEYMARAERTAPTVRPNSLAACDTVNVRSNATSRSASDQRCGPRSAFGFGTSLA